MKKQTITIKQQQTMIKVQNTKIEGIRMKDIEKRGLRLFENGKIGVAGALGKVTFEELEAQAKEHLKVGIDYPYDLEKNKSRHKKNPIAVMNPGTLNEKAEGILEILRRDFSDFDFSQDIYTNTLRYEMEGDDNLDLSYEDAYYSIELAIKEKSTANLIDGFLLCSGRSFNEEAFWKYNRPYLEAYRNSAELPEGEKLPVLTLNGQHLLMFLGRQLNGERYGTGSSLYSGKMKDKLFDGRVNLVIDRIGETMPVPFFDMEGVYHEGDEYPLIENGFLVGVYTDKETASKYDLPETGSAGGDYDDLPVLGFPHLTLKSDTKNLKEALGGKAAILVLISSGGDFTPDGKYGAPVQVSFLYDGEKILGKLPEFSISGHINDLLGKDYIGTFDNDYFYVGDRKTGFQASYMTITR